MNEFESRIQSFSHYLLMMNKTNESTVSQMLNIARKKVTNTKEQTQFLMHWMFHNGTKFIRYQGHNISGLGLMVEENSAPPLARMDSKIPFVWETLILF